MTHDNAFLAQYEAATTRAGMCSLDDWTTLRITGADRVTFLHNMCSNDIRSLKVGESREALLTQVNGKITAHVAVLVDDNALLLLATPGQAAKIMTHLERYIITEAVELHDVTEDFAWLVVTGEPSIVGAGAGGLEQHELPKSGRTLLEASWPLLWPHGRTFGAMRKWKLFAANATMFSSSVWNTLRIESGLPLFGVDFNDSNLAQEVGRNALAINFRKGCYLGQETIARIDALGHVNKQIATVKFASDDIPTVGSELTAGGQVVGRVTSVCWSPKLGSALGLAMVKRGYFDAGSKLECAGRGAEVIETPAVPFEGPRRLAGG